MTDRAQLVLLGRRYLAPQWRPLAALVGAGLATAGLAALLPTLLAPMLDLALGRMPAPPAEGEGLSLTTLGAASLAWLGVDRAADPRPVLLGLALAFAGVGVLRGAAEYASALLALRIRIRAGGALQTDLFGHLLGLSLGFFGRERGGELLARLDEDTQAATEGLDAIAVALLTAPLLIAVYGVLLVRTSPALVAATLAAAALHYSVTRGVRRPLRRSATAYFTAVADVGARLHDTLLCVRVVKSLSVEAAEVARMARLLTHEVRAHLVRSAWKHVEEPARGLVNHLGEIAVLLVAAWELMAGRLTAPAFVLFLWVGRAVTTQVGRLGAGWTRAQATLAAGARIGTLLAERAVLADGDEPVEGFRDRITLRGVSFDYGDGRVLDRVDLEIRRGETVALVGPSGGGKSTLTDLVLRLRDPQEGVVTLDGRDVRRLRLADYRRLFGVVPQDALLFHASVRDNIVYGRAGLTEADVVRAARASNAHEFICALPDRYETVIGDRGVRLSGGQRQRIAIARALVAGPPVLVLDEATSALDRESERLVQEAIERAIQSATAVVVAHRLATVRRADRVVVVEGGRITAEGRHDALVAASPTYAQLWRLEMAEAETGGRA
ncbi:MAG: ABC transporter ATP-binding protein [Candidatus Rokuibacteriota bacterium]|nr:MAG: ABC transporter ATP-binding protein [Candidatus Rokubacteria bacterium]